MVKMDYVREKSYEKLIAMIEISGIWILLII